METFGPNPEVMIKSIVDAEKRKIRIDNTLDTAEKKRRIERLNSAWAEGTVRSGKLARWYAELNGETFSPVNVSIAKGASFIRGMQSISKLGGATLSAFADVFVKANAIRYRGDNLLSSWSKAFNVMVEGRTPAETKANARRLGVFIDASMGSLLTRFNPQDQFSGRMASAMDKFFKYSGLTGWTEAHKAGFVYTLANDMGENASKSFDALTPDLQVVMKRHGVTPEKWDIFRKLTEVDPDGKKILVPENARKLSDADILPMIQEDLRQTQPPKGKSISQHQAARRNAINRARRDLETDLMAFYADECKYAIIEPDDRTRSAMIWGTRPGTFMGEALRFTTQFKSFPIAYYQRVLSEGRWRLASESGFLSNALGMSHFATSAIIFGYISMTAKDISRGKKPKDPLMWETWLAAAMQSGGAGIFGDFLFSKANRMGGGLTGTLAGPSIGMAERGLTIAQDLVRGETEDAGADATRFLLDNAPFINLWYTRAAMDYLFNYHVREMLSPGTLRRTERKLKKEYNQEYFIPPSKVVRRGGGY